MRVKILLAIPDDKSYGPCTMVLDSIRVGYPNAIIEVYVNLIGHLNRDLDDELVRRAYSKECQVTHLRKENHHAEWIKQIVEIHAADLGDQEPLIILDGDIFFKKSCENWKFDTFLAGYKVPQIWNDFAQCRSFSRLHTSHLWFSNPRTMLEHIREVVPASFGAHSEYCPLDIFRPRTMVVDKEPFFWDSAAVAYQLLGGTPFGAEHLDCYEHLTSASAFDIMHERLENKKGFEWLHTEGWKHPELFGNELWASQQRYYAEKANQFKP